MQTPLQITFRGIESSGAVQEWIQEEAAKLETFYRPIMGCRVAVEAPHRHHRRGIQYHVRIDLTLPGGELVVKHQPNPRSRAFQEQKAKISKRLETGIAHKDLRVAVADAFRVAGRRLQDHARKQAGHVKLHEPASIARVNRIMGDEGYGFLITPDGQEVYFHKDSVLNKGFNRLKVGTRVIFVEEQGEKGLQASSVRVMGKQGRRQVARASAGAG
jgi:cold shock CspA family protein/ribosome-associated translation inhibitor RaiA